MDAALGPNDIVRNLSGNLGVNKERLWSDVAVGGPDSGRPLPPQIQSTGGMARSNPYGPSKPTTSGAGVGDADASNRADISNLAEISAMMSPAAQASFTRRQHVMSFTEQYG